uniref:Cytochrome b n=1 Tax=Sulcionema specki TaxID=2016126 RepID=A0A6G5ZUY1_9EUGL|nr:apocytochrome b [Sulcionema specki]
MLYTNTPTSLLTWAVSHSSYYVTNQSITVMYNLGMLSGISFGIQVASGIVIALSYVGHYDYSFLVLADLMRDGVLGWILRGVHANGASVVFLFMYMHVVRNMGYSNGTVVYYLVWLAGLIVWLLMMGVAFLGYVLPWGLMSYWALTVITNLITVIPIVGVDILYYVWGGYYVTSTTLHRLFGMHFLLPFLILLLLMVHLMVLHVYGSGNASITSTGYLDHEHFLIFYYKDLLSALWSIAIFILCIFVYSDTLHHADNYCYVDRFVTPKHIVPEWYFLPFYALLRACSNKQIGVLMLVMGIVIFLFLVSIHTSLRYSRSLGVEVETGVLVYTLLLLGILGQSSPIYPYVETSGVLSVVVFGIHIMF